MLRHIIPLAIWNIVYFRRSLRKCKRLVDGMGVLLIPIRKANAFLLFFSIFFCKERKWRKQRIKEIIGSETSSVPVISSEYSLIVGFSGGFIRE